MSDRPHVAAIVASYPKRNAIAYDRLPELIASVASALDNAANPSPANAEKSPTPAVPIRRSVLPDRIICLECSHSGLTLKRHIFAKHALTPDTYCDLWAETGLSNGRARLHDAPQRARQNAWARPTTRCV